MTEPKVSILIPAYNQPESLRVALESIECQTFTDYTIIITDDSRDDGCYTVSKEFYDRGLPVNYHKNKVRFGSPQNWNESLNSANGEYIKFLHHDDWFTATDSLQIFVDALDDNPQSDFSFSGANACDANRVVEWVHLPVPEDLDRLKHSPAQILRKNIIGAPSATIYRRSAGVMFDPELKWLVDIDFYYRMLKKNPDFVFIPGDPISVAHGIPGQVSLDYQNNAFKRWIEWAYLVSKVIIRSV